MVSPALTNIHDQAKSLISEAFRTLLENYHLYQNYNIDWIRAKLSEIVENVQGELQKSKAKIEAQALHRPWEISRPGLGINNNEVFMIEIPTVRLFCTVCDRQEAFNPMAGFDLFTPFALPGINVLARRENPIDQTFVLSYRCQYCKKNPETFIVRRIGERLSIHGRSPIEFGVVPESIPKEERKYYFDAVLAYNCGQILPAIFMLRVFIEQFAYRMTSNKYDKPDKALDSYYENLNEKFRANFPSLRVLYEQLSAAIHKAEANEILFEETKDKLDQHFDGRKAYRL